MACEEEGIDHIKLASGKASLFGNCTFLVGGALKRALTGFVQPRWSKIKGLFKDL